MSCRVETPQGRFPVMAQTSSTPSRQDFLATVSGGVVLLVVDYTNRVCRIAHGFET